MLNSKKPKIAIIEFDISHMECIYSQILFLKDSYEITIFTNSKNATVFPEISYINHIKLNLENKKTYRYLKKQLIKENINKVIFNSAERKIFRFLLLFLFNTKISFWGILHNPNRLKTSLKQKFISKKLKGYFVLSDFIKHNIQKDKLTSTRIESVYLIFLNKEEETSVLKKNSNEIWILIPGRVESSRRDYSFLLQFKDIPKHIKFIILGNLNTIEGLEFQKEISKTQYQNQFIYFKNHVSDNDFYQYISQANYILPLVHPNNKLFYKYLKYKITASYNWAYAFQKTMLLEQSFSKNKEFTETSYFYNYLKPLSFFNFLDQSTKNYTSEKWNLENQKNKYLNFIKKNN